jgi:hypothetical protein
MCHNKQVVEQCLVVVGAKQVKLIQNEYNGLGHVLLPDLRQCSRNAKLSAN